jgi:hypothetical protein
MPCQEFQVSAGRSEEVACLELQKGLIKQRSTKDSRRHCLPTTLVIACNVCCATKEQNLQAICHETSPKSSLSVA